jgi:hypothetical protein
VAWPIWDLIAAGHLLGMTEMAAYPRPGLRDDLTFEPGGGRGTIRWITRLDDPRLWRDFQEKLRRHARAGR